MKITHKAFLITLVSIALFFSICFGLVALLKHFPVITGISILSICTVLYGRSIYLKELERLKSEDAESTEA